MGDASSNPPTLRDYLQIARRRALIIVLALVLVPLAAVAFSLQQERLYESSAEVLLSRQNLAATLTGTQDPNAGQQADRLAQTQASLARVPRVARSVLHATGLRDRSPQDVLDASSVIPKANADLLEFRITDPDSTIASRLASEYARQFIRFRRDLDTSALLRARMEVERRIASLEARGDRTSALYGSLVEKQQQLRTMEALQTSNVLLVREAGTARQVQPRPVRNAILGLVVGLALGIGLAFLWEALDTRVRSAELIGEALALPLLGRLPTPSRTLRKQNRLVMLADVGSGHAEAYRMLRMNLEFATLDRDAQAIMVTGALQDEGKSTVAANLAIAFARAGRHVVLVDLDLRRPVLDQFFGLEGAPGLTNAVLGEVPLEQAIARVALTVPDQALLAGGNGNGVAPIAGILEVVPSGPIPPDPGEFLATGAFFRQFDALRSQADLVIVDTPPMLHVGDALGLSALVDGLLIVTRLGSARRSALAELRRRLDASPARKLGFVVSGAEVEDGYADAYGYGFAGVYGYAKGYLRPAKQHKQERV